jgi:hypothetical protein
MHLVGRGQVHEADVVEGRRPDSAHVEGGPPGGGFDEVHEDVRGHAAILPA